MSRATAVVSDEPQIDPAGVALPGFLSADPSTVKPGDAFTFDAAHADTVVASPLFTVTDRPDGGVPDAADQPDDGVDDDPDPAPTVGRRNRKDHP